MDILLSYGMLTLSTTMFGTQFFFNDIFRRNYGNHLRAVFISIFGGGLFGLASLMIIQIISNGGIVFEYSNFSFVMAIINNANSFLLSYCGLKALGKINLSMYSLFIMLGGMVMPFISGILIHGEPLGIGKILCFITIILSLFVVKGIGGGKSGSIFYIGVFVLNGMAGVLSKLYHALPERYENFEKISSAGYSILNVLISLVLSGAVLLLLKGEKKRLNLKSILAMGGGAILNRIANLLLLEALIVLPASAQYPFITGGTIIVSAIISLFTDKKPTKRELISVTIAFIGILFLLIPEKYTIFEMGWKI